MMRKLYVLVSVLLLMATSFGCLALQTLTPTAAAPYGGGCCSQTL